MKTVNWGVLGTAGIAMKHVIPGMKQTEDCRLLAIAGRDREKADLYQKTFGFEKTYLSYDALLDDPEIDAVYLPLPNSLHYEWAIKALRKGKHVLCEKPLAPTAQQAEEMVQTGQENGVLLLQQNSRRTALRNEKGKTLGLPAAETTRKEKTIAGEITTSMISPAIFDHTRSIPVPPTQSTSTVLFSNLCQYYCMCHHRSTQRTAF